MKNFNKKTIIAVLAIVVILAIISIAGKNSSMKSVANNFDLSLDKKSEEPLTDTTFALDTFITVTIYHGGDENVLKDSLDFIRKYEMVFSATNPDAELYKLNHRGKGVMSVKASEDLAYLIDKALYYSKVSNGAFDITTQPLKELWDFNTDDPKLPSDESIKEALPKVDYTRVSVEGDTINFTSDDTQIDLGAIAKGYIADKTKEFLKSKGVDSAIINLGGNVLCIGKKPDGQNFTIGLQKPYADRNETVALLTVDDESVVSSGVYERHFVIDGKNYHHILNPKTGYPYDNGLVEVSILTKSSTDADALSTTCFSLGVQEGVKLLNSIPDTYGYFILSDYSIVYSDGAKEQLAE
ncbi:MAG: FAD:protein FMN transferase [Lachnoanaerobaculum sp.]|nr:FAD:protein FMN transferase [Lachnoanaerobaculum sp.]